MTDRPDTPRAVRSIWPPLRLLALSVGYAIWAQRYGSVPRLMPTIVGVSTAVLCVLDLLSRFDTGPGRAIRVALGADFRDREMKHDPALRAEVAQVGWMVGCIVLILLIGILPTVPLFICAYMMTVGRQPLLPSAASGAGVFAVVYLIFEQVLDYALYRGALFEAGGFAAW